MATKVTNEVYTKLVEEVNTLLDTNKVKAPTKEALIMLLNSYLQTSNTREVNAPKEIDGVMHYYCRFHQCYEAETNMVISGGKSKGYCKAAISKWNKTNSYIKRVEAKSSASIIAGDFDKAKEYAVEANELKIKLNMPSEYNLESDWLEFNA